MLVEHGVHDGPVTPTTRHVLQNKLSKVMSQQNGTYQQMDTYEQMDTYSDTYTVEEVMNTAACLVTEEASSEPLQATEGFQTYTEIHETPVVYDHSEADLIREDSESQAYEPRPYEYTPTSQTLRYARDSYPSADNLRRRPLNTPKTTVVEHTSSMKVEKTHATSSTCSTTSGATCKKTSWICNRVFLIIILLVLCFVAVVYYHMEHNDIHSIPAADPPAADDKPPVGSGPSR